VSGTARTTTREDRRRELERRTKAQLVRMLQPHVMTANPLTSWTKAEIVSGLLDHEFPPAVSQ
jgi:hypothetical protein